MSAEQGLALFGGTFDPPHLGHLTVARDAFSGLPVRRVVWIPCGQPPHKSGRRVTAPDLRLEMTCAAVAADDRFTVDDLEIRRKGASYTVDTLREIRLRAPEAALFLLIGPDQAAAFRGWRRPREIARLARVVVLAPGGERPPCTGIDSQVLAVARVNVRSTDVRACFRDGGELRDRVSDPVRAIVEREGLYRDRRREVNAQPVRPSAPLGGATGSAPTASWKNQ